MKILRMILTAPIWMPMFMIGMFILAITDSRYGTWLVLTALWISGEAIEE